MAIKNFKTNYGLATTSDAVAANTKPTLLFDFARSKSIDARLTFTRPSVATYVGPAGLIVTANTEEPRFEYSTQTSVCKGLLYEDQRTNGLRNSLNIHDSVWTKSFTNTQANTAIAPDGNQTAVTVIEDTSNNRHYVGQTSLLGYTANSFVTASLFLKQKERNVVYITIGLSGSPFTRGGIRVNLTNGSFVYSSVGSPLFVRAVVTPFNDGWYRCAITTRIDTTSTNIGYLEFGPINELDQNTYAGDGTSGFYAWGGQVEDGVGATSIIPTLGSAVTRSRDTLTFNSPDSSWYNLERGTIYTESYKTFYGTDNASRVLVDIGSALSFQRHWLWSGLPDRYLTSVYYNGGTEVESFYTYTGDVLNKMVLSYASNNYAASFNGIANSSTALIRIRDNNNPTLTVGRFITGDVTRWNGHIAKVAYFPTNLSLREVATITQP